MTSLKLCIVRNFVYFFFDWEIFLPGRTWFGKIPIRNEKFLIFGRAILITLILTFSQSQMLTCAKNISCYEHQYNYLFLIKPYCSTAGQRPPPKFFHVSFLRQQSTSMIRNLILKLNYKSYLMFTTRASSLDNSKT